jgi:hypothetical protein
MSVTIGCVRILDDNGLVHVERIGYPETRTALAAHQVEMLERVLARVTQPRKRMGFRVDTRMLDLEEELRMTVQVSGQSVAAAPMDVSLTGARAYFVSQSVYVGQRTSLTLEFGHDVVMLPANVVRIEGNEVAFQFDIGKPGDDPPLALVRLYRRLELAWLRSRANGERPPTIQDRGRH